MTKHVLLISCALIGASFLSACDDSSKLTADQQFQLKQMELSQKNQIRQEQHELDMARATNPPPVIQQGVQEPEVYRDVPSPPVYPEDNYQQQTSSGSSSGSSVGSHVATAAIGAAAGYVAGKYTSTPQGQQKVDLYKDKSKSMYNSTKQKAYTGYRFTKSKVTSKYRSFKKR